MVVRVRNRRKTKIPFKQSEFDRLHTKKSIASLAFKKARRELADYVRTHTSGISRLAKGDKWY